jgi:hypothetical protein
MSDAPRTPRLEFVRLKSAGWLAIRIDDMTLEQAREAIRTLGGPVYVAARECPDLEAKSHG